MWVSSQFCPEYCISRRKCASLYSFRCCHPYCFQLFDQLRVPFPYFSCIFQLRCDHIHQTISLILVSRFGSVKISSVLPECALPFPITFSLFVCMSREVFREISTSRPVCWFTTGNSSCPHFLLNVTEFTLSSLHTTTAHFFCARCHSSLRSVL